MELEILKLIYDYLINKKLVDSNYIDKIIEIVVNQKELDNYVQKVVYNDYLKKSKFGAICASYNYFNNNISIYHESIQMITENRSFYNSLFGDLERIIFKNLIVTHFILHELEHAYQIKQADNDSDNSIEAKLIRASLGFLQVINKPYFWYLLDNSDISKEDFELYVINDRKLRNQYYRLDPIERLADINSFKTVVKIIEPIKKVFPNLYNFYNASLVEAMLRAYPESWNEGICPSQVYLYAIRHENKWNDLDFYSKDPFQLIKNVSDKYSLDQRLSMGLPITYNEYKEKNDWFMKTNKFIILQKK